MNEKLNITEITPVVEEHFDIVSHTIVDDELISHIQYIGKIKRDNVEIGFNELLNELRNLNKIAFLEESNDLMALTIYQEIQKKPEKKIPLNLLMFLLTLLSVLFTGGLYAFQDELPQNTIELIFSLIKSGWPFAVSLLAILAAHEFGHYFAGKKNGIDVTLPLFIPFPFSTFGTMGAFISMKSVPRTKKELFDLAVAGPLCGLIISIIVLLIGLNLSEINTLPLSAENNIGLQMEGNSLLYLFLKYISFNKLLPNPQGLDFVPKIFFWVRYFFTGMPFPWGSEDVMLHPVAWAGWAGLFVTTINLLPIGQLDGGHIFQTVFGQKVMRFIFPIILAFLVIFGFFWAGWWSWAAILFFFGSHYAKPLNQITPLDNKRRLLGYLMVLIFLITFIPVPITIIGI